MEKKSSLIFPLVISNLLGVVAGMAIFLVLPVREGLDFWMELFGWKTGPVVEVRLDVTPKRWSYSDAELEQERQRLRDFIFGSNPGDQNVSFEAIGPRQLSELVGEENLAEMVGALESVPDYYRISGRFPELVGYQWHSLFVDNGADRLLVYHQGHRGNPFDLDYVQEILPRLLARGYDLLVLVMPGLAWNVIEDVKIQTWDGWGFLAGRHERHQFFDIVDTGDSHYLKYFVGPVLWSLDAVSDKKPYRRIVMVGISGGGWTTTLAAALDQRIDDSVSIAGTLPFFAQQLARDIGHTEMLARDFYREFAYPLLYTLGVSPRGAVRRQYQVFNSEDDWNFDGRPAAVAARGMEQAGLALEGFEIRVVENRHHTIAVEPFFELLGEIEQRAN